MPQYFVRPENALTRAQELLDVGKEADALETLHDVLKARRHRQWTQAHEQIMNKHLELCVQLRKSHVAKDALWQYRNLVQQINVKSLEDVVAKFLKNAEKKVEKARQESVDMVEEVFVEDLDQIQSPESLLLSAVSGADAQDRADRTVLSPWLRFLWDSYRNCLELLRNNAQVETLYHKIARQAFEFCHKYQRRAEFRKLSDNLRQHLNQIQRQQNYPHGVKLNSPETLTMLQETRLNQLDVSIKMELWQEAYKSADDMFHIMELSRDKDRRMVKAQTYVTYYDKVGLVFWKSGNTLFHAAALLKLFQMFRDMKKTFSPEDATHMATRVVLATLSIQAGAGNPSDLARHLDMEDTAVANQRQLAQLLALKSPPTRKTLLREIARLNLAEMCLAPVKKLHLLLEQEFNPLRLASKIDEQLASIIDLDNEVYSRYVGAIREVATVKIIKQLSQVYDSVTLERLQVIVPYYDAIRLEKFIVMAGKNNLLEARVDHQNKSIQFGGEGMLTANSAQLSVVPVEPSESEATLLGTSVAAQLMEKSALRTQLQTLYSALDEAMYVLQAAERAKGKESKLGHAVTIYKYHAQDDYNRVMERRRRIEAYKETSEHERNRLKAEEERETVRKEEERRHMEQSRLERERKAYAENKAKQEAEELRIRMLRDKMDSLKDTTIGKKVLEDIDEDAIEKLNVQELYRIQVEKMEKERKDQTHRLKAQEKKWDYWIRALHQEEIPVRKEYFTNWREEDVNKWEKHETERVATAREEHAYRASTYERLSRVQEDAAEFMEKVHDSRKADMQARIDAWKAKLESERNKRLQQRRDERKKQRELEYRKEKQEQDRRDKEEADRRKNEEERAKYRRDRGDTRPARQDDIEEGRSDVTDWRAGMQPAAAARTRAPVGPPAADTETNWRRGPAPEEGREPPPAPYQDEHDRRMEGDRGPPPRPTAPEGPWRRAEPMPDRATPPQEYRDHGPQMDRRPAAPPPSEGPWRRAEPPPERSASPHEFERFRDRPPMERRPAPPPSEGAWRRAEPLPDRPPPTGLPLEERGPPRDYGRFPERDHAPPMDRRPPPSEGAWRRAEPMPERGPPRDDYGRYPDRGPPMDRPWRRADPGMDRGPPPAQDYGRFPQRERGPPMERYGPPQEGSWRGGGERQPGPPQPEDRDGWVQVGRGPRRDPRDQPPPPAPARDLGPRW